MPVQDSAALRQTGLHALRQGQFTEAASLFAALVAQQPRDQDAWLALGLALARGWKIPELLGMAESWGRARAEPFAALYDAFTLLMSYGLHEQVIALAELAPQDGPLALPGLYYQGCILLLEEDEDGAFACFGAFKRLARDHRDSLPIGAEHPFNVAYRQGSLIEDRDHVAALMAAPAQPEPPLDHAWEPRFPQTTHALMAACNGAYFDLFAEDYVQVVDRMAERPCLLHLHVVEPTEGLVERARTLAGTLGRTTLNLTTEPRPDHPGAAYYASARFLIAGRLLELYGRDLFVSDIDITFLRDPAPLLPSLAGAAFAGYTHSGFGPASRHPAGITWFSRASGGGDAAEAIARLIRSKLNVPWPHNWMLDQAAIISALRWLRHARPDLTILRMNEAFGCPVTDVFAPQERDEAKQAALDGARDPR